MGVDEHPEHEHTIPRGAEAPTWGTCTTPSWKRKDLAWAGTAGSHRPPGGRAQHGHDGFRSRSAATTATW